MPELETHFKDGEDAMFEWPCRQCKKSYLPKFWNPSKVPGQGRFHPVCPACALNNIEMLIDETAK